jgi:hypothetical protein
MRVFISWSGELSHSIALALREKLPMIIQAVEPWMSTEEIGSGARWNAELAAALEATNFGIVCATKLNQLAPWLLFESGALAKSVEEGRLVPLCIDLLPSDITGPLAAFQARRLHEADIMRLVKDLNAASEKPMPAGRVNDVFHLVWPDLESAIAGALSQTADIELSEMDGKPERQVKDMLAEVVDAVRRIERSADRSVVVDAARLAPPPSFDADAREEESPSLQVARGVKYDDP